VAKAAACGNTDAIEEIMKAKNPKTQKLLGSAIVTTDDWESEKEATMKDICQAKFDQNPELMDFLLGTKSTHISEDNPNDSYWGLGVSRRNPESSNARNMPGNRMGIILMSIRDSHVQQMD
jgi:hypothetical protein